MSSLPAPKPTQANVAAAYERFVDYLRDMTLCPRLLSACLAVEAASRRLSSLPASETGSAGFCRMLRQRAAHRGVCFAPSFFRSGFMRMVSGRSLQKLLEPVSFAFSVRRAAVGLW